jgi:sugar O-acyltransferase (sialic acid O-acetyltransferase NeuD family)
LKTAARRVAILGAAGNALDILDILDACRAASDPWEVAGLLDDWLAVGSDWHGLRVLGRLGEAAYLAAPGGPLADAAFVNAIASERTHRRKAAILAGTGLAPERFATLVHPRAAVSARARLGRGVCLGPGCAIAGAVVIEDHAWLGAHVVVGHDSVLGACATLAAAATIAGGVRLGASAYVGSGAVIRPGCVVGEGAMIGMGAVVLRDVAPGATLVGNPARPLGPSAS